MFLQDLKKRVRAIRQELIDHALAMVFSPFPATRGHLLMTQIVCRIFMFIVDMINLLLKTDYGENTHQEAKENQQREQNKQQEAMKREQERQMEQQDAMKREQKEQMEAQEALKREQKEQMEQQETLKREQKEQMDQQDAFKREQKEQMEQMADPQASGGAVPPAALASPAPASPTSIVASPPPVPEPSLGHLPPVTPHVSEPADSAQAPYDGLPHSPTSAQTAPVESLAPTVTAAPSNDVLKPSLRAPPPPQLSSLIKNADIGNSAPPGEDIRPGSASVLAPAVENPDSDSNRQAESAEAKTLVSRANASQREGDFADALVLYTQALEKARNTDLQSAVYFNRSVALARMFRWEEALQDANECVKINPNWPRGPECQGTALEGLGRLPEALAAFENALALEPGNQVSSCLQSACFGREAHS